MRRLSPSTLRQRVIPPVPRRIFSVSPTSTRALQTSSSIRLPRSTSTRRTFVASTVNSAAEDHHEYHPPVEETLEESTHESTSLPDLPDSLPDGEPDLFSYTTSVQRLPASSSALPDELGPALTHLYTSFLPGNQHLAEELQSSSPFTHVISFPDGPGRPRTEAAERPEDEGLSALEAVMALTSPFEGGEAYVSKAVKRLANEMNADVLRIDLMMALGLDGPASPLGSRDVSPPQLPISLNPLYLPAPRAPGGPQKEMEDSEDGDERNDMPGMAFTSVPIAVVGGGGMAPPGLSGLPGMGGPEDDIPPGQINQEWVNFFTRLINAGQNQPGQKRIIVLESAIAMSKSFPLWWPSFIEAVRRRRKGSLTVGKNGRPVKGVKSAKTSTSTLLYPTSIILQCTPSIALPHTSPAFASSGRDEDGSLRPDEEDHEEDHESEDPARAAIAAIEEKFKSMGINVQSHVEVVKPKTDAKLWWGSEESDIVGRREGDRERLSEMLSKGISALMPTFGAKPAEGGSQRGPINPLRRLLMNRFGSAASRSEETQDPAASLVWKAYPVLPQHRNFNMERDTRIQQRRVWTAALVQRAVHQLGGALADPLEVLNVSEITGKPLTRRTESSGSGKGWGNVVISWTDALHISSIALGTAARKGQFEDERVTVTWQDIVAARKAMKAEKQIASEQIKRHLPSITKKADEKTKTQLESAPQQTLDPVVEHIKRSKNLSQHEKRLLPCIVDPTKLASTSFKNVYLPEKTVDGIRSMVSLPLLFPEAFRGGVLKDHATTGALLFGPPGTGKTLLARAVAAESGARMLAIQPSDVNDMYVGEGEKLVKAVFNLARRLSPCVVFLDEVDALFGARISRGSAGSMSHNLLLTEFMQEMDGLSSAIANKDKRVVVIGATNRPFDLDDAVLRRLPRRLLVDLPDVEGRKAILQILLKGEQLADDVDLERLAKETDGFSGSDLKHLCVSAALSAVKDTVQVPWAKDASAETGLPTATSSHPASAGSGLINGVFAYAAPDNGGGGGRKKAKVTKQKTASPVATATAGPSRIFAMSGQTRAMSSTSPSHEMDESRAEDERVVGMEGEGDQQISQDEVDELLNANKMGREPSSDEGAATSEDDQDEAQTSPATEIKPRIVAWKHFKVALSEIRPSSSEEGSLPELRKWAEQFGEGGSRKGKKSGFGKGFGFSDEKPKDRESGYGRVKQDDQ